MNRPLTIFTNDLRSQEGLLPRDAGEKPENRFGRSFGVGHHSPRSPSFLPTLSDSQLTEQEYRIVNGAEIALQEGLQLRQQWEQVDAENPYREQFELIRTA